MNDCSPTALLDPPQIKRAAMSETAIAASPEPTWIRRGHIPGLDGLRAVAVLMVLLTHAFQSVGFPDWPAVKYIARQGVIGVDIFFVISGFLITTLLVRELERDGSVQLKRFYLRRFLRIIPAYVCLMLVLAIFQWCGYYQLKARDWIGAATYTTNFLYKPSWELGHSWSLSVEEHFYLLWPFVLSAGGVAAGWRVGLICVVVCWMIRAGIAFGLSTLILPADSEWDVTRCALMAENWTFTRLDTITMGSLLALGCRTANGRVWLDRLTTPEMFWVWLVTFYTSIVLSESSKYLLCVAYTLNAVCIALLMWGLIQSKGLAPRILRNPLLTAIGYGSYSIYLWQQLFIHPRQPGWIHEFPQNVVLALGAAALSFWVIERPLNQWKDKVAG